MRWDEHGCDAVDWAEEPRPACFARGLSARLAFSARRQFRRRKTGERAQSNKSRSRHSRLPAQEAALPPPQWRPRLCQTQTAISRHRNVARETTCRRLDAPAAVAAVQIASICAGSCAANLN